MRKLRIAFVLNRFYPEIGGAETNLYYQACELAKQHDVTVFTPLRNKDTQQFEKLNGFTVFRLKDWKNISAIYPNNSRDTFIGGVFFKILFGHFDIVHAFPALNKNNMLALLASKLRGIPFVLSFFDLLDYSEIERQTGHLDDSVLNQYNPGFIHRLCLKCCSHILAISFREINVLKKYNANVDYCHVPVMPKEFETQHECIRNKYGIAKNVMLFLVLGRISRLKGQDLAIKAFIQVAKDMPNSVMVIVGRSDYEPAFHDELKKLVAENGLESRILFTGMVERREVIAFLKESDIHVIPVRFMNSGAVVVESWAAGTPVIQSDAVDPNLVVEDYNGYIFPNEDITMLASKIFKAYSNRQLLANMGHNGWKLVKECYTYDSLIKLYYKLYGNLLP